MRKEKVQDEGDVVAYDEDHDGVVREVGEKDNRQYESVVF